MTTSEQAAREAVWLASDVASHIGLDGALDAYRDAILAEQEAKVTMLTEALRTLVDSTVRLLRTHSSEVTIEGTAGEDK